MEQQWRRIGSTLSHHTTAVLVGALVLTVALLPGLAQLEFATGQDSYLDDDDPAAVSNEAYQELFGGETMLVLFTADEGRSVADLFTPANIAAIEEMEAQLRADDVVASVISPLTVLTWTQDLVTSGVATQVLAGATARETDEALIELRQRNDLITALRAGAAGEPSFENPDWVEFLLFDNQGFAVTAENELVAPADENLVIRRSLRGFIPDREHALFAAVLTGNASLDELADGDDAVEAAVEGRDFENVEAIVTGTPTFLRDINDYLQGGMLTLGLIALVVMAVVLVLGFRVRWRLLPLAVVILGVLWGFGLFGYLGIDLSLVTISGLPILIGIGVDFAIQVHSRVEEECVVDRHETPFAETMGRLGSPLAIATIAAVVAFLSMLISKVPMIRDFGVLLAVGMVMMLVAGITIPLAVLGLRERRTPTSEVADPGVIGRVVSRLGSLPRAAVVPLVLLALALPVLGVVLEGSAEIESDPINWADQDTDTIRNARELEDETGFATSLGVFVQTGVPNGVFSDQVAAAVHDLAGDVIDGEDVVVEGSSIVTTLSYLIAIPGATPLPPLGADVQAAYDVAPPDVQRLLVSDDGSAANISLRVGPSSLDDRADLIDRIDDRITQPPADAAAFPAFSEATPAGLARVGVGLLDNLTANRVALTATALLLVSAWLLIRLMNVGRALLAMVPVVFAVGASATLVSLLGITLSQLTTVSAPLVAATCAEFSVLILHRYLEERERGLDPDDASETASTRTGRAFTASALTTIGGFGVLAFSALPLLRDFGAIVTLNVAIALLSALVVVPPLARWADARGWLFAGEPGHEPEGLIAPRWASLGLGGAAAVVAAVFIVVALGDDDDDVSAAVVADGPAGVAPATDADEAANTAPQDGPSERPDGLVAGGLYDAYTAAGADPVVARCLTDTLLAEVTEAELLAAGIASSPPGEEAAALVGAAADACGMPQEVSDAVAAGATAAPGTTAAPETADAPETTEVSETTEGDGDGEAGTAPQDGPSERPDGLVAGGLYDAYTAAGADPVVARCLTDTLLAEVTEAELLAAGIASSPPGEEAAALVAAAADACGMPEEVSEAVAAGAG